MRDKLTRSRNRIFSTSVKYRLRTITEKVDDTIPPTIDIEEPLVAIPGTIIRPKFIYTLGWMPAHSFMLEWFETEEKSEEGTSPLKQSAFIPSATIFPQIPEPGDGTRGFADFVLKGYVKIYYPFNVVYPTLWGKLSICNDSAFKEVQRQVPDESYDPGWRGATR